MVSHEFFVLSSVVFLSSEHFGFSCLLEGLIGKVLVRQTRGTEFNSWQPRKSRSESMCLWHQHSCGKTGNGRRRNHGSWWSRWPSMHSGRHETGMGCIVRTLTQSDPLPPCVLQYTAYYTSTHKNGHTCILIHINVHIHK